MPPGECPASRASGAHLAIAAAEVDERSAFGRVDCDHLAEENRVIAAGELVVNRALQGGQRAADQRHSELAAAQLDAGELVLRARGETRGDLLLLGAENADAELAGG